MALDTLAQQPERGGVGVSPGTPGHPTRAPGATMHRSHTGIALIVISLAQLMVVLDVTIVNVALPTIQHSLHFSIDNLVWVSTAYSLTYGGLLLFGGRTGDLFGRRRMFMFGIAVFAGASMLGGLAQDSTWLIMTRATQGIGAAIASPTALSLIATNFSEGTARNRAMGVYAAVSGAGSAIGLLLGGLLVDFTSWRWVLFINVPIGICVLLATPRVLRESERIRGRLDWRGALSATAGMVTLVYGLTNASSHGWTSEGTVVTLLAAVALLATFVLLELHSAHPLLPLHLFKDRNRTGTYVTMLLLGAGIFSVFYFMTLFFQDILGYSPLRTGIYFLVFSAAIIISAQVSARLVRRLGPRLLVPAGVALSALGMGWLSTIGVRTDFLDVLGPFLVLGSGMGLAFVPLTLGALSGVAHHETGIASALLNTGQQIGGAIGLAALSTLAVTTGRSKLEALAAAHHGVVTQHLADVATADGYGHAFVIGAVIVAVAFVVALVAVRVKGVRPLPAPVAPFSGVEPSPELADAALADAALADALPATS